MRKLQKLLCVSALVGSLSPMPTIAQNAENAVPERGDQTPQTPELDETAAVAKLLGLSRAEAEDRQIATQLIEREARKISAAFPESFIATIIEDRPASVALVFDKDVRISEINALVDPNLRKYIKIKRSRFTAGEIAAYQSRIIDLLPSDRGSILVGYNHAKDKFRVEIEKGDALKAFRASLPQDLRGIIELSQNEISSFQSSQRFAFADDPYGYSSTSVLWGGWPVYEGTAKVCTAGFVTKDYNTQATGVVTAGHCANSLSVKYTEVDNSYKSLGIPDVDRFGALSAGRSYDYQHHPATAITSKRGYVYFDANTVGRFRYDCDVNQTNCKEGQFANVDGALPSRGYAKVTYAIQSNSANSSNPSHPLNAVRCKMGMTTGLSCGIITESSVYAEIALTPDSSTTTSFYGIVRVEPRDFMVMGYHGDSGGPVFTRPTFNASSGWWETWAAGTLIGGNPKYEGSVYSGTHRPCVSGLVDRYGADSCSILYMPIDRINDHKSSIAIATVVGEQDSYVIP